jgi:16S rRNA (cytosine967-C5)-methyltransferase
MVIAASVKESVADAGRPRLAAARLVQQVVSRGRALADPLPADCGADPRDRDLVQELAYGTVRWYPRLSKTLDQLLERPLPGKHADIRALLCVGLYQLAFTRVPDYAAVSATVNAARHMKKTWSVKLINAVLRGYLRRRAEIERSLASDAEAESAHPQWLLDCIKRTWPDEWPAIIAANNRRPPLTLRVNLASTTRDAYLTQLREAGFTAQPSSIVATGINLAEPTDVRGLPGYAAGLFSVQDAAAQLAAPLLQLEDGHRVLDACAAPGGKATAILEQAKCELVAIDTSPERVMRIGENLARLRLSAHLLCTDAADTADWWNGQSFDRILIDAPCSGSGVIRRHPDIKLLRRPGDVDRLARQQQHLLHALWPLLRCGGKLLYATCSILAAENNEQMQQFLASCADAEAETLYLSCGKPLAKGWQVLPGDQDMDGFFYARITKRPTRL